MRFGGGLVVWLSMKELFILIAHLLTTMVRLAQPGGARSVVAQSLALRHQLLVLQRRRKRAPRLAPRCGGRIANSRRKSLAQRLLQDLRATNQGVGGELEQPTWLLI